MCDVKVKIVKLKEITMPNINKRNLPGYAVQDPGSIHNLEYSDQSGAQKVTEVGRHLIPFGSVATGFTTNVTTVTALPGMGRNLAVYNNAGAVGSITIGATSTITALAPGITDAAGDVGIPCQPNSWTYIAAYDGTFVIASAATLLVFLIDDNTKIKPQAAQSNLSVEPFQPVLA